VIVYIRLAPEVFNKFFFGDLPGGPSGGH
jgi:hypothetical protein